VPDTAPTWTSVRARPGRDPGRDPGGDDDGRRTACLAALFATGAQGVHEDGASLVTHFPPGFDLERVHRALTEADPDVVVETSTVANVDWSEAWKARIVAHDLGALTVTPPWLAHGFDASTSIVIEPGMAFGTGDHATTRGVIRLLPAVLRRGDTVADLGAGSAVLAIAAAKLGAGLVYAIELDADSIADANANVEANGVAAIVHVFEGDAAVLMPLVAPVRLVLANIISSVLLELFPIIEHGLTSDGVAIISGILREERAMMVAALTARGWHITAEDAEDIWWSAAIARD
jgi:ribosomal protein L11 methyltransferase